MVNSHNSRSVFHHLRRIRFYFKNNEAAKRERTRGTAVIRWTLDYTRYEASSGSRRRVLSAAV
ncbi:unnamed protein product, partial [Ectocarpus sp. 13 AM-2016]